MRIGIIEAGEPPPALVDRFGDYAAMTQRLLGDGHAYTTFRAARDEWPEAKECEAYIITGSACSVYDPLPWIAKLEGFLRTMRDEACLVGICFGHQVMAQAFGGRVQKTPQGWGIGLHRYDIRQRAVWMDAVNIVDVTASHQDQIVAPPPDVDILGASTFAPYAMLSYRRHAALTMQFHPEFEPAYSRALFAARRAPDLCPEDIRRAIASLSEPNDNERLGRWINAFLADHCTA